MIFLSKGCRYATQKEDFVTQNAKDLPDGRSVVDGKLIYRYFIYKLVNLDNGKIYIGATFNPQKRATQHFYGIKYHRHSNLLVNADSHCDFGFEIVYEAKDYWDAREMEAYYMKQFHSYDERFGYNALDHKAQRFRKEDGLPYRKYGSHKRKEH